MPKLKRQRPVRHVLVPKPPTPPGAPQSILSVDPSSGMKRAPMLSRFAHVISGVKHSIRDMAASAFMFGATAEQRFDGLRTFTWLTWPHFVDDVKMDAEGGWGIKPSNAWNPWMERRFRAFTNEEHAVRQGNSVFRFIGLTGVGASGKSHDVGIYALAWWAVAPHESIVVLTSTTKDMIRNRAWSNIARYHGCMADLESGQAIPLGRMIDSQMKLKASDKESLYSIGAYAVAHGETLKAIDNLKGLHATRMLIVIDEANGTPEAIMQVIANYRKGCRDMTVIAIGNPSQRLDPHGRLCKPKDGWALTADDKRVEWATEGVPDWQIDSGLCLRFDGRDSPNVVANQNKWPYLYTLDNWVNAQALFEDHGGTFNYWTQDRGMWPPDGFAATVFTEQLFIRCDSMDTHFTFRGEIEQYAFLDTAFGGDACILHFAQVGDDVDTGRSAMQLTEWLEVPIDPTVQQYDRDYQIARRVQQECIVRRISPHNFGLDATGTGRGVAAILAAEWSNSIHYVNWGVGATERASAQNDGRPSREVYTTFVTECHYAVREGMEAGQIKGFSHEAVTQFCSRLFEMKGKKYRLETKEEMRLRLRFSPDIADSIVGLYEISRRNGAMTIEGKVTKVANSQWSERLKEAQEDSALDVNAMTTAASGGGWAEGGFDVRGGW